MKKITKVIAILLAMVLVLCSCGEKKEESQQEADVSYTYGDFDYSADLDDRGYFKDVKALDYVTLPSLDKIVVKQADIDAQIEELMNTPEYMKEIQNDKADRIIANYDNVNIDYVGSIDGVEFEGGNTNGNGATVQIGVTSYIDDFLEQLIGHHPGETINVEVTFPEDYGKEELNGKDALFVTKINYVVDYEKNELNNAFVKEYFSANEWTTVKDFQTGVSRSLAENQVRAAAKYAEESPAVVADNYVGRMMDGVYQSALQYGLDIDTYVSYAFADYGITKADQVKAAYDTYKNVAAQEYLFYQAIAETKGFTIGGEELAKYYKTYGITDDDVAMMKKVYGLNYIKSMALYDKVIDYLYTLIVIE